MGSRLEGAQNMDTLVMPSAEALRHDVLLRKYLVGRDWDLDGEQQLVRHLVTNSLELLPEWPLLVGYEWGPPGGTRGDLLFFDGTASFAAVEVKSLENQPTKKRNLVERQAREAAERAEVLWPEAHTTPLVYTDDEHQIGAPPRSPDDRIRYG